MEPWRSVGGRQIFNWIIQTKDRQQDIDAELGPHGWEVRVTAAISWKNIWQSCFPLVSGKDKWVGRAGRGAGIVCQIAVGCPCWPGEQVVGRGSNKRSSPELLACRFQTHWTQL